jgi:hypothetical protein
MLCLAGVVSQSLLQPPEALTQANAVRSMAKFVPAPTVPPVITQGSGTR